MLSQWLRPRVVVYGIHCESWTRATGVHAPVWKRLPEVQHVAHVAAGKMHWAAHRAPATVVLPLMEDHILSCPQRLPALIPAAETVRLLRDKKRFAFYAREHGLSQYLPASYETADEFPCLLKRTDLNAGRGIVYLERPADLFDCLQQPTWQNSHYVLQEYLATGEEFSTYAVFRNGEMLLERTYRFCAKAYKFRHGKPKTPARCVELPGEIHQQLMQVMQPLHYNGPCCIDYRIREDGRIAVMEINPRLGGTLMKPPFVEDLRVFLRCIIRQALLSSRSPLSRYAAEKFLPGGE